ncbi:MAG: Rrf2 family transcriptional regulator [Defluviimonas sp.]|nr:Rrf2 family transcriptional regulator [Defluviimonas sp.]
MRLTTRTNLAMRALMFCAVNGGRYVRKHEIAAACNASENHLAQVVNTLAQLGFVDTQRGRSGGLRLSRPMDQISVGQVFRVFEAGVPFTECFDPEANTCPLSGCCRLRGALDHALEAFYSSLDGLSLADLVEDNLPLEHLLLLVTPRPAAGCAPPLPVQTH